LRKKFLSIVTSKRIKEEQDTQLAKYELLIMFQQLCNYKNNILMQIYKVNLF